jgi:hypothetical protein
MEPTPLRARVTSDLRAAKSNSAAKRCPRSRGQQLSQLESGAAEAPPASAQKGGDFFARHDLLE